ncbi:glycosyl transferase family 2 [Paenibacillus odorifer]|nr:glycosyl transferase family 2 [Paenibacillus odorifer]
MPCYNDGEYIEQAINSIRSQTYNNIELIIIDDGSTDPNTIITLNKFNNTDIILLRTDNTRPAAARNTGIAHATGKYIMPVDADDIIEPTYIEKAVKIIESNKKIGVVYCYADLFGDRTGRWSLPNYSLDAMLLDNVVFVTSLFYKEDWEKVGGFKTTMYHGMEDYDFWLSIIELDKEIYQIPEVLFNYRIKPKSRTTEFMSNAEIVKQTYRSIYNQHPKLYEQYTNEYAVILRDALIEQIFLNRALQEGIAILDKLKSIPLLKLIIKKYIMKR